VNVGFSGVPLQPGTYAIDLRYKLPGLKQGKVLSAVGLLLFLALLARNHTFTLAESSMRGEP